MKIIGMIPARMGSSRFFGKPLVKIEGLPMVIHVMKRALLCKDLSEVFVATDSKEIYDVVTYHKGKAIMTSTKHQTGTDRIREAIRKIDCDIVVNIQGDEPLVKPKDIGKLVKTVIKKPGIETATLVCKSHKFNNPTDCKVALDLNGNILYMSRSDIPSPARAEFENLYKLYCVVAFRLSFLKKFSSWLPTPLEKIESIEYLRILEHGYRMRGVIIEEYTTSVDTPKDLEVVKEMMKKDRIKFKYL